MWMQMWMRQLVSVDWVSAHFARMLTIQLASFSPSKTLLSPFHSMPRTHLQRTTVVFSASFASEGPCCSRVLKSRERGCGWAVSKLVLRDLSWSYIMLCFVSFYYTDRTTTTSLLCCPAANTRAAIFRQVATFERFPFCCYLRRYICRPTASK